MAKIIDTLASLFRSRNKPTPPRMPARDPETIPEGHRGIAAGDLKRRQEEGFTQEEIDKWRRIPAGQVRDFVVDSVPLFVHSSNVSMLQYYPETQQLQVEFLNGSAYLYSDIDVNLAIEFATATSKGGKVWDSLRIRGTKRGHKKPYKRIK